MEKEGLFSSSFAPNSNEVPKYCRYLSFDGRYAVFFARLENGQIEPIYSVIINAETGEVPSKPDPAANGLG